MSRIEDILILVKYTSQKYVGACGESQVPKALNITAQELLNLPVNAYDAFSRVFMDQY